MRPELWPELLAWLLAVIVSVVEACLEGEPLDREDRRRPPVLAPGTHLDPVPGEADAGIPIGDPGSPL